MTLTDTIKELRGLLEKAPVLPWGLYGRGIGSGDYQINSEATDDFIASVCPEKGDAKVVFDLITKTVNHLPTLLEAAERAEQWQQMHDSVQQTNAALVKKLTDISERAERYELALYVLGPAAASYLEAIDKKMEWFAVDARRDFLLSGLAEFRKAIAQPLQPTPPPASKVCEACGGSGLVVLERESCIVCDGTGKDKAFREGGE